MANVGGGAAYQRLQVPEDGVGQALQFWGAQAAKKEEGEKLAKEREGVRKTAEVQTWEKTYGLKAEDFKSKYTGFKNFDDMNTDFSLYATDQYVDLQRKAKEAVLSGNAKERSKYEGEMIKLKGAFGEASKSQAALSNLYASYQKASQEGKVSGASGDFEAAMQAGFKDMNVALRFKDGNLVYTGLDEDGKVINIPHQDIMDGSFNWINKQQIRGKGGVIDGILENLGKVTKEGKQGYYDISTQAWDEGIHGKSTDEAIDALVSDDDTMADLLYQGSKGEISKRNGFTDADYKKVKDGLKAGVRGGYTEKFGSKFNAAAYGTDVRAGLEREKMRAAKTKKEDKNVVEAEPITTAEGQLVGGYPKVTTDADGNQVQAGGEYTLKTKSGTPIKGVLANDSDAEILSIKKSGGGYFVQTRKTEEVSQKDQRSGSTKKVKETSTDVVRLTDEELNRLARRMDLPTAGDLDKYLDSRAEAYRQGAGQEGTKETIKW